MSLSGPVRTIVVEPVQVPQQEPAPKPQPVTGSVEELRHADHSSTNPEA